MPEQPISIDKWKSLIRQGGLKDCLTQVVNWTKDHDEFENTAIALQSRLSILQTNNQRGRLSNDEFTREQGKIRDDLQLLIDNIDESKLLIVEKVDRKLAPVSTNEKGFRESLRKILPKKYVGLEVLSEGDYNIIYKAYDRDTEREVAIKAFKNVSLIQDQNAKKLEDKFKLVQQLSDVSGIVRIIDSELRQFPRYYVMLYIHGLDLDDYLKQDWPISIHEKRELLLNIARALQKGHQDDLFHLNLRPSNIKIDLNGNPQLLPFQIVPVNFSRQNIKRVKKLVTYWSPEQINGQQTTDKTDLYALGLVAYELFTRKPLFSGETVIELFQQRFKLQKSIEAKYDDLDKQDLLEQELSKTDCPPFFIATIRELLNEDPAIRFPGKNIEDVIYEIREIEANRSRVKKEFRNLEKSLISCRKKEKFYQEFYQSFFEQKPDYVVLFEQAFQAKDRSKASSGSMATLTHLNEQQKKKRWQFQYRMLDLAMERMLLFHEQAPQIESRMTQLAKSHQSFGIAHEDFELFLNCMKDALLKADPRRWPTPSAIEEIWKEFTAPILAFMQKQD